MESFNSKQFNNSLKNNITFVQDNLSISKKGVFMKWLELNDKIGGQNKIPRLSNERKFIDSLIELNS